MQDVSQVRELVQAFRENHKALKDEGTPEAVIRQEYIDAFWGLLGWDVHNQQHRSLAEKDVVVEPNVATVEGHEIHQRRPDYLFRIDGFPRFIIEAKKCTVDVATDRDAIFQAKTYAWNAQIPFAILTNFERFRLFDATVRPNYHAAGGEVIADFDLKFEDYEQQWDVLEQTFGREAVAAGSLEKLLAKIKHVRAGRRIRGIDRMLIDLHGSEPVDKAFLADIEGFRLRLARELYRENRAAFPEADSRHGAAKLADATQRLIDRLVFIRVCEDRDITSYGELRDTVNAARDNRTELYPAIVRLFRRFDERYNGYLFKAHFSEELTIPPDSLVDFIRSLYLPDGPYRFNHIGDDILGIIYERFLGSAITVTRGVVDAEPKPEVRHAGGVYYTPKFVVDTIVRRVVGPKIEGKRPAEILDVKILDPACGSGSFLIAALQYLYTHCLKCFERDASLATAEVTEKRGKVNRKVKKRLGFQDAEGNWYLMPEFRGQILQSCMYGVDIDAQAVEVTIMSLYLKMLEGRLPEFWQRDMLEKRLLPPLDNNIRCGNSLISQTDFDRYWENKFGNLFGGDKEVRFRINAFDWRSPTLGFGRVFEERDGFDCIIGNPPYIRVQELNKWAPEECEFYKANYQAAKQGNYDIYVVFIEKALSLLAPGGLLGFICPHKFWQATYGKGVREIIAKGRHIKSIIDFGDQQVFRGVTTYTAIHVFAEQHRPHLIEYAAVLKLYDGSQQCAVMDAGTAQSDVAVFPANHPQDSSPWVFRNSDAEAWCEKVAARAIPLREVATEIFVGLQTSADTVFLFEEFSPGAESTRVLSAELGCQVEIESALLKRVVRSGFVGRYNAAPTALVLFPYSVEHGSAKLLSEKVMEKTYPMAWRYLRSNEKLLRSREHGKFDHSEWYGLMRKNLEKWEGSKIMIPYMVSELGAFYDASGGYYFVNVTTGGFGVRSRVIDPWLLTALLSSSLLDRWFKAQAGKFHGGYFGANKQYIENLPMKVPETQPELKLARQIIGLSQRLHHSNRGLLEKALSGRERTQLEREVEAHEKEIDELVCELYGVKEMPE